MKRGTRPRKPATRWLRENKRPAPEKERDATVLQRLKRDFKQNYQAYLMVIPSIVLIFIFCYIPMYGILIAFQNYRPQAGVFGSEWVGLANFVDFFQSPHALKIIRNTLFISVYTLAVTFPCPILLALLLNEVRCRAFKRTVQTISYMPYFVSTVVICGMLKSFLAYDGVFNEIVKLFGGTPASYLSSAALFPSVIVFSDLWQSVGWNSIIYIAALTNIDPNLYEAARMDGCGRLRQMWHITLPGIVPTMTVLMILSIGGLLSANSDKILLLYTPLTYETGDVIGTFIYRRGLKGGDYSYSEAVGLFQTAINFLLLVFANWFSNKTTETSLW